MHNEPDPKKSDMEQYKEIIRSLTDKFGDLDPHNPVNAIMWTVHCVQECYEGDEPTPDPGRAANVVTSLSWLIMKLLETIDESRLSARKFADELLENDLVTIETFEGKATLEVAHEELGTVAEFELDFGDMGSLLETVELILIEIDLMRDLSALDDPGFIEGLGNDSPHPE